MLRIANPQSINRLGHFLTPDCKSGGTPGGLAVLKKELLCGTTSGLAILKKELFCGTPGGLAVLKKELLCGTTSGLAILKKELFCGTPSGLAVLKNETPSKHIIKLKVKSSKFNIQSSTFKV